MAHFVAHSMAFKINRKLRKRQREISWKVRNGQRKDRDIWNKEKGRHSLFTEKQKGEERKTDRQIVYMCSTYINE